MKHLVNQWTAAMQDARDLLETHSSPTETPDAAIGDAARETEARPAEAEAESRALSDEAPSVEAIFAAAATTAAAAAQPAVEQRSEPIESRAKTEDAASDARKAERETSGQEEGRRRAPPVEPPRASLIPFVAPRARSSRLGALGRLAADRRLQTGAAAACLALVAVVAGGAMVEGAVRSERESHRLTQSVSALAARIEAIEAAKPRDEAAEIRKAVGEARGGLASSREVSATVAQLNARLDRLEREQQARLDKLGERLERDAATRGADAQARSADLSARVDKLERTDIAARLDRLEKADVATRLDKLEKADVASRIDKVERKIATTAAPPSAALAPPQKETIAAALPGVSNEVTGSIEKPHPTEPIRGWYLVEMRNGSALVESRQGLRQVAPGDTIPGAGKVERFEKRGREWVVVTDQGVIPQAAAGTYAPRVVLRPPIFGPYGGFGPGYGYED